MYHAIDLCDNLTFILKEKEKRFLHFTMKNLWEENNFSFTEKWEAMSIGLKLVPKKRITDIRVRKILICKRQV